MVWFDSVSQEYLLHAFNRIESDPALNGVYFQILAIDSKGRVKLAEKVTEKSPADRDLSFPNQNSEIYLPIRFFWGGLTINWSMIRPALRLGRQSLAIALD